MTLGSWTTNGGVIIKKQRLEEQRDAGGISNVTNDKVNSLISRPHKYTITWKDQKGT